MPVVTQQNKTGAKPTPANGVLARIAPVKAVSVDRQKWAIYGVPKSGKTRFACSFKKPLLLIGAEDGTASIAGIKGVDFIQVHNLAEFDEVVAEVASTNRWASVVVDTLSKLRDIRINEIFKEMGIAPPEKKPFLYADKVWKTVWTQTGKDLRDALRLLLDLPRLKPINVLVISQEANLVFDEGTGSPGSDLIRPAIGSAVGKSLCDWLHAECDYIGQTLIREQTGTEDIASGVPMTRKTGKKEYCLRVSPDGVYQAGFRLPEGRVMSEEFIIGPTYEKVCALIRGTAKG